MSTHEPVWPRITGASLLLVPLAYREREWSRAEEVVRTAIENLGVAVARGMACCPSYVRPGAESLVAELGNDVLVFSCPADIGIFEAAPLVSAAETSMMLREVATFFRRTSEAALSLADRVAWVVAHDWSPGDRVRWDSGDIDRLVEFATCSGAWRTTFLVAAGRISSDGEWPYWFEVTRTGAEAVPFRQRL